MKKPSIISFFLFISIIFSNCKKEEILGSNISDLLWLENKGAQMPILVEGNSQSKTFILLLHGGPGGSAKNYNEMNSGFSDSLEEKYAVAYWDQRMAGNARGHFDIKHFSKEVMIEDLGLAIDLLRHRYGKDIAIFLMGHSWGGYLGNAFLVKKENQEKIKGWIDVDGAHNIGKLTKDALKLMKSVAKEQIFANTRIKNDWESIIDFVNKTDSTYIDKDKSLEVNNVAGKAEIYATKDGLIDGRSPSSSEFFSTFLGDYSIISQFTNSIQVNRSNIWQEILDAPLTDQLPHIKVPTLLIWGEYDFIVPPSLGEEMFQKLGTPENDKSLHVLENCGHSPPDSKTEEVVKLILDFVGKYK